MTDRNIKYKNICRISLFGDDNINTNGQYQYPLTGSTVNNACKMRFNLKGNLGDLNLSEMVKKMFPLVRRKFWILS